MLSACETYQPDYREGEPWDTNVASANDGIYINLPFADELIRVNAGGISVVDTGWCRTKSSGGISRWVTGARIYSQQECKDDDSDIVFPEDCDDLVENAVLSIVSDAATCQKSTFQVI